MWCSGFQPAWLIYVYTHYHNDKNTTNNISSNLHNVQFLFSWNHHAFLHLSTAVTSFPHQLLSCSSPLLPSQCFWNNLSSCSLSLPVALLSHPRFGVNSRKDTRAEMLTRSGQRKSMNGSSLRAHHSTDTSECFIKPNDREGNLHRYTLKHSIFF